jgi:hypothetical protein
MKFLSSAFGVAAVKIPADTVVPLKGLIIKDLVDGIARRYEFQGKPPVQGTMQSQALVFQGGASNIDKQRTGVMQLALVPNGDFVMAQTTEQADAILSDLLSYLEDAFGYRYSSSEQRRVYLSNVVVQFEKDFGRTFERFAEIQSLLNEGAETIPQRFQFKRLAFGTGDPSLLNLSIEAIEIADFTIERRALEPYSSNRFFCGAPMQTEKHLRVLEKLEDIF